MTNAPHFSCLGLATYCAILRSKIIACRHFFMRIPQLALSEMPDDGNWLLSVHLLFARLATYSDCTSGQAVSAAIKTLLILLIFALLDVYQHVGFPPDHSCLFLFGFSLLFADWFLKVEAVAKFPAGMSMAWICIWHWISKVRGIVADCEMLSGCLLPEIALRIILRTKFCHAVVLIKATLLNFGLVIEAADEGLDEW